MRGLADISRRRATAACLGAFVTVAVIAASCTVPPGPGVGDVAPPGRHVEVWSVLPPGNGYPGGPLARHLDDQRPLYERLDRAVARDQLDESRLGEFFKQADIDLPAGAEVRTQRPAPGVVIRWDRWGVPHVEGDTSVDVAKGAGFATMEGRAFVAELARVVGRRGAQELGVNDLFAAIDPDVRIDWSDDELEARLDAMVLADPEQGALVLAEMDAYLEGIRLWVGRNPEHRLVTELLGIGDRPWTRADLVASLLTVVTGNASGGGELANAAARQALSGRLGTDLADAFFADLRSTDAATTTHVDTPSPYPLFDDGSGPLTPFDPGRVDPRAVAVPDDPAAMPAAQPSDPKPQHSNVIAVTADRSATGHPLFVGGPQNGFTSPSLLFEMSLSGGGYRARGVTIPGGGPYVFVGRSDDYAWTSTSGETDQTDVRAELLCEPDGSAPTVSSNHHVFDGECVPFRLPPGATRRTVPRSVHGPVIARGAVGGQPVAFTTQRASSGLETVAAIGLRRMNRGELTGPADFVDAARTVAFTGHWFYVDRAHIAYALVGEHPVRAAGVDPDLPSWGTGEWEWRGRVDPADLPSEVDPASGCLHSWNNKVAPGWSTADDDWGNVGPHRVDLLVDRVCGRDGLTLTDVVAAHTEAGSTDLRGEAVLPVVLDVLAGSAAPTPVLERVRGQLADWVQRGATRRDLNGDLRYDHPAVGIVDALFEPLVREVFGPALGDTIAAVPLRIDAGARTTGSSFGFGWYGLLTRDLDRVLGRDAQGAIAPVACGGGDRSACQQRLWSAMATASREVQSRQWPWDRDRPQRWWTPTVPAGRIVVLPVVFNPVTMAWSNRPAYQLAVEFR